MDERELNAFRERLLKEKESLEEELKYINTTLENSEQEWSGENSSYDNHMGDLGTNIDMRQRDLSLSLNTQDLLNQVNRALKRIEDGTYGFCRVCGRPIEMERLKAIPYAELCIEDKKAEERSW
ncbi:MAG: TraR/DksA C4-type zinc finger protein [Firmicutes bacterium]|nr:TraR/DksA C4-type zinc finger protein [Bacillota bacterium]